MLSWLPKLPLIEFKRRGSRENLEDALQDPSCHPPNQDDMSCPRTPNMSCPQTPNMSCPQTPRTPRLERSRNCRRHFDLDMMEITSRRSMSSFSSASDSTTHIESVPSPMSEPVSPMHIQKFEPSLLPHLESSPEHTSSSWFPRAESPHSSQPHLIGRNYNQEGESPGSGGSSSPKWMEEAASGLVWSDSCFPADSDPNLRVQRRTKENASGHIQADCSNESIESSLYPVVHHKTEAQTRMREKMKDFGSSAVTCLKQDERKTKKNLRANLSLQERTAYQDQSSNHRSPYKSSSPSPLSSPKLRSGFMSPHSPGIADGFHGWQYDSRPCPLPLPPPPRVPSGCLRSDVEMTNSSEGCSSAHSRAVSPKWPRKTNEFPTSGSKWVKGKLLGSGSFGKVYRGHNSETGEMCAIKEVEIVADDPRSKERANQFSQEIALLSVLKHPNILHYRGSELVGNSLHIYLELVSGGSIYRLLQEFDKFTESVIRRYTRQILCGLQYLHSKNTVHRDIKCANILVDEDGKVKLADFGTAKLIGEELSPLSFKGSPYWMAPELITQESSGFELAVDIWSLGCTIIEMATGKPPWYEYTVIQAMFKVSRADDIPIPETLSSQGQEFVRLCLQRDPSQRPTATQLLQHPFILGDNNFDRYQQSTTSQVSMERHRFQPSSHSQIESIGVPSDHAAKGLIPSIPISSRPVSMSVQRRKRLTSKRRG